ncbi:unnamed protein product [Sphagnum balticum]
MRTLLLLISFNFYSFKSHVDQSTFNEIHSLKASFAKSLSIAVLKVALTPLLMSWPGESTLTMLNMSSLSQTCTSTSSSLLGGALGIASGSSGQNERVALSMRGALKNSLALSTSSFYLATHSHDKANVNMTRWSQRVFPSHWPSPPSPSSSSNCSPEQDIDNRISHQPSSNLGLDDIGPVGVRNKPQVDFCHE